MSGAGIVKGIIFRHIFVFACFSAAPHNPPEAQHIAYLLLWLQGLSYHKDTVTGQVSRLTEHRQQSRGSQGPFLGRWGSCYRGQWLGIIRGFSFQKQCHQCMRPNLSSSPSLHLSPPLWFVLSFTGRDEGMLMKGCENQRGKYETS